MIIKQSHQKRTRRVIRRYRSQPDSAITLISLGLHLSPHIEYEPRKYLSFFFQIPNTLCDPSYLDDHKSSSIWGSPFSVMPSQMVYTPSQNRAQPPHLSLTSKSWIFNVLKTTVVCHPLLSQATRKPTSLLWPYNQHATTTLLMVTAKSPGTDTSLPLSPSTTNTITNIFRHY